MRFSLKKAAAGAVRFGALTHFGPLAGGLFLAGGAVVSRVSAEGEWAQTSAEMLMHLASDKSSELFGAVRWALVTNRKPKARVALKRPFGAVRKGYCGPKMV